MYGLDAPLKAGEGENHDDEYPVLQDIRGSEAFPKAIGPERPVLRVGADEEKKREPAKDQRPVPGPTCMPARRERCENAGGQDDETSPIVVVLRPRNVALGRRTIGLAPRGVGLGRCFCPMPPLPFRPARWRH